MPVSILAFMVTKQLLSVVLPPGSNFEASSRWPTNRSDEWRADIIYTINGAQVRKRKPANLELKHLLTMDHENSDVQPARDRLIICMPFFSVSSVSEELLIEKEIQGSEEKVVVSMLRIQDIVIEDNCEVIGKLQLHLDAVEDLIVVVQSFLQQ